MKLSKASLRKLRPQKPRSKRATLPQPSKSLPKDPFFGLKYIAFLRTTLPLAPEDQDEASLLEFAKWQICKARNVLWGDPIWDSYTAQELLIEFFALRFEESEELRKTFENGLIEAKQSDIDWMLEAERRYLSQNTQTDIINEKKPQEPDEFEDDFS